MATRKKSAKSRPRKAGRRTGPTAAEMAYGMYQRSGFNADQLPLLAQKGDAKSLEACAGVAAAIWHRTEVPAHLEGLKDWLLNALWEMRAGKTPDQAFGWSNRKANRPRDFMAANRQIQIVRSVQARIDRSPERSRLDVFAEVAKAYSVSKETVESYYNHREQNP